MLRISYSQEFGRKTVYFFILIFLPLLLTSCDREVKVKKDLSLKNGVIFETNSQKLFSGTISDTLSNHILTYEVFEGVRNGDFRVTNLSGKTLMSGTIKDNKHEGKWKYYYTSGKIESAGSFKNDLAEGKWAWFYENGTLKEEGSFVNGKRDGVWVIYDEKGNVKSTTVFRAGEKISESGKKNLLLT